MDEIFFHISNHLETLQVHSSLAIQQGEQWLAALLTHCQNYLEELYRGQYVQHMKHVLYNLTRYIDRCWDQLLYQYHALQINFTHFSQQLVTVCANEVTRREIIFCLAGITIGTLIGYCIGKNWGHYTYHMHHIQAIICHRYIGIEGASVIDDAEMPMIQKSNDILIQVKAASVNVVDAKICNGYSKTYRRLLNSGRHKDIPVILGRDCAGLIVDIGRSVINFDIGDEVFLAVPSWAPGTMAEYVVIPETQVAKRPKRCSYESATSIPYNGCIAWDALVNKSVIEEGNAKGQMVLIYGGNTPVGHILIQLVKLWGGYVVTVCSENAVPVMSALGADEVISFNKSDIEKELELHDKFNAIFYTGGIPIESHELKKCLHPHGSYVSTVPEYLVSDSLGFISGSIFGAYVRFKLFVQYVFGFNTHHWKEGYKINAEYLQALSDLIDADQIQPVIDRVFTPHHIEDALRHILEPDAIGSTIIKF